MTQNSVYDEEYQSTVARLIKEKNEVLITVRYPYQAGNKDLFLIDSMESFKNLLSDREPSDLIVIDNSIKKITQGIVTKEFITDILIKIKFQAEESLVVIFPEFNGNLDYWNDAIDNLEDLQDDLTINKGRYAHMYREPYKLEESKMIYAYVPDSDGKIRPAAY